MRILITVLIAMLVLTGCGDGNYEEKQLHPLQDDVPPDTTDDTGIDDVFDDPDTVAPPQIPS